MALGKWRQEASRLAPFAAITGVAVLRHFTGGATSPVTPLFAFPVIWVALTDSRRAVLASVVVMAAAFALPIVLAGAPDYPRSDWLRWALWVVVAAVAGATVQRLRNKVEEGEVRNRTIASLSRDPFVVIDDRGRVTEWSPAAEHVFGWSRDEAVGGELAVLLIPLSHREAHRRGLARFVETGSGPLVGRPVEVNALCKDGRERPVQLTITPDRREEGWQFLAVLHDLSVHHHASHMEQLAHTDPLTHLANRRGLDEHLDREMARARRTGDPLTIVLLDLDRFKSFNDQHGHGAGDRLLFRVAHAWRLELRESDLLARHGGDEFAAVLPDCPLEDGFALAERLRTVTPVEISCSVGVAEWDGQEDVGQLLERADVGLYADKEARGNGGLAQDPSA
jgi:diguanylate cyclase (GGDEF)-like protein/PAS domain S-box-containing protein